MSTLTQDEITTKIKIKEALLKVLPKQITVLQSSDKEDDKKKLKIKEALQKALPKQIEALKLQVQQLSAASASVAQPPVAASAASASGVPPVAPSAAAPSAAEEIKKKHLALLSQCGFITAEPAKK